jgi:hypothetical protein
MNEPVEGHYKDAADQSSKSPKASSDEEGSTPEMLPQKFGVGENCKSEANVDNRCEGPDGKDPPDAHEREDRIRMQTKWKVHRMGRVKEARRDSLQIRYAAASPKAPRIIEPSESDVLRSRCRLECWLGCPCDGNKSENPPGDRKKSESLKEERTDKQQEEGCSNERPYDE